MRVLRTYKEVSRYLQRYRRISDCLVDGVDFSGMASEILLSQFHNFTNTIFRNCSFSTDSYTTLQFSCSGKVTFDSCSFTKLRLSIEGTSFETTMGGNVLSFVNVKADSTIDIFTGFDSIILDRSSVKSFIAESSVRNSLIAVSSDVQNLILGDEDGSGFTRVLINSKSPLIINKSNIRRLSYEFNVIIEKVTKESGVLKALKDAGVSESNLNCSIIDSNLTNMSFSGITIGWDFKIVSSDVKNADFSQVVYDSNYTFGKKHITLIDCKNLESVKIPKGFEIKEAGARKGTYHIVEKN